jgi:hypothetical protein
LYTYVHFSAWRRVQGDQEPILRSRFTTPAL